MHIYERGMDMSRLNDKDLTEALDKLFDKMQKMGITISDDAKKDLKKELVSELAGKFTHDEIKNPHTQKKLMACVTSFVLGKKDAFNNLVNDLKDEDKRCEPDKSVEKKLICEMMLIKIIGFMLDPKNNKTLSPDALNKTLDSKLPKPSPEEKSKKDLQKDEEEVNEIKKQLDDTLRNLYGGDNPTITGEVQFPILGPVFGNLLGYTNQTIPDPNGLSEMVESNTFNAGKSDPLGLENMIKNIEGISESNSLDISPSSSPRLSPSQ